jgi:hypothetical protein
MARVLEGRNRASAEEASSFVDECDRVEQDRERQLHDLDIEFKAKKREINRKANEEIKAQLADAKKVGVAKGVIRSIVDGQKQIRKHAEALDSAKEKAKGRVDELEPDQRTQAVDILAALGADFAGFGLGAAAVEREEAEPKQDPTTAAIVDAANKAWDEAAPSKKGAAKH